MKFWMMITIMRISLAISYWLSRTARVTYLVGETSTGQKFLFVAATLFKPEYAVTKKLLMCYCFGRGLTHFMKIILFGDEELSSQVKNSGFWIGGFCIRLEGLVLNYCKYL